MREAIGGSQLLMIVITLIIIIMMLLAGSIGYTKAFKARNAVLNIVQKNGGYGISVDKVLETSEKEIVDVLKDMGYKTSIGSNNKCSDRGTDQVAKDTNYNFCIYQFTDEYGNQHYGVETYMYFELPIFGRNDMFAIPIYGDTYTFYKYGI